MRGAGSKRKGKRFEHDVSNGFSKWFYGEEGLLAPTPMSGG